MDKRLIPVNGLIALLRGEGGWPAELQRQGFRRHQLELPISTPQGDVRVDAVIYRCSPNVIVLCEAKSGRNIDSDQARKYMAADATWLRRSGAIPPELHERSDIDVCALFVGQEEHRSALEMGLREIQAPLLTVGAQRVRLSGTSGMLGLDDFDVRHEGGLPPARIPVDHQSGDGDLMERLVPQIIAAQAGSEDMLSIEAIGERILPEWVVLSHGAREAFIGRVAELVRGLADGPMRGQLRYEALRQRHTRGRIVIEATPASRDPRGRTQAWQAQRRRAAVALKRRQERERGGQMSLDELADQGGLAEE